MNSSKQSSFFSDGLFFLLRLLLLPVRKGTVSRTAYDLMLLRLHRKMKEFRSAVQCWPLLDGPGVVLGRWHSFFSSSSPSFSASRHPTYNHRACCWADMAMWMESSEQRGTRRLVYIPNLGVVAP